jgi:archaellum component FlaF (FlaF/FlaG flagellin family)
MGFSVSAATTVLLLAMVLAFGVFQAAVFEGAERRTEAADAAEELRLDRANTDLELGAVEHDAAADRLVVRVNNTGATALSVESVDLLVDNRYVDAETSVGNRTDTDLWLPGETLVLEAPLADADRVRVVAGPGVAETGVV